MRCVCLPLQLIDTPECCHRYSFVYIRDSWDCSLFKSVSAKCCIDLENPRARCQCSQICHWKLGESQSWTDGKLARVTEHCAVGRVKRPLMFVSGSMESGRDEGHGVPGDRLTLGLLSYSQNGETLHLHTWSGRWQRRMWQRPNRWKSAFHRDSRPTEPHVGI